MTSNEADSDDQTRRVSSESLNEHVKTTVERRRDNKSGGC